MRAVFLRILIPAVPHAQYSNSSSATYAQYSNSSSATCTVFQFQQCHMHSIPIPAVPHRQYSNSNNITCPIFQFQQYPMPYIPTSATYLAKYPNPSNVTYFTNAGSLKCFALNTTEPMRSCIPKEDKVCCENCVRHSCHICRAF